MEPVKTAAVKKSKLNYKEEKELENLEKEIVVIENKLKELSDELNAKGIENNKLAAVLKDIEKLKSHLEEKSMRWMELTELKEA
jgi:ATP-binding cassette subfamily F protein uup